MAWSDIRFDARQELVSAIRAALAPVQVDLAYPGDALEREAVWLDESDGSWTVPVFTGPDTTANPITYDDRFIIPIDIMSGLAGKTPAEVEERLQVLCSAVVQVLRTNPTLSELDGVLSATIRRLLGPRTLPTKEGFVSFARIEVEVHARITGAAP